MITQINKSVRASLHAYGGIIIEYRGKSTDSKPTLASENNGSTYYEIDTQSMYMYDGEAGQWVFQFSLAAE